MRLNTVAQKIIKAEVADLLGPGNIVRLFGSRVDDNQRGGDIDLLIESAVPVENKVETECKLAARLYIKLGGRKVDVLIIDEFTPLMPVHQQAIEHGVIL